MRITGLATGMDMDNVIKESMKPYQIKINQTTQKKDVVEIKQKLYRDIIKDNREFFSKHLDILKSDSLLKTSNWSSISFTSTDDNAVTAKASGGAIKDNYTVSVTQMASKASTTLSDGVTGTQTVTFGSGATAFSINFEASSDSATTIDNFNKAIATKKAETGLTSEQLKALNVTVKHSDISKGIVFEANDFGQGGFQITNCSDAIDKALQATITNSKNETYNVTSSNGNTATVDGITFNFNQKCAGVTLTAKTDAKALKDKVVAFVNDYNKLIEELNTTVNTKHDRSYMPLTADQKKAMSEDEVKLWNEKVEKGQLYKDSDITKIVSSMKESMRTLMSDTGLNLESIGINPVKDYSGNLNGTFTIDEDKLTTALENNTENVMNLFIGNSDSADKSQRGILYQLEDTINIEFMKSTSSSLLKKAGFEGTSTFSTNELSKSLTDYEKKIQDMQKDFSRREQALYSKYATLEKMMNKLNAQQSNMMSQLGMS